MKNLRYLGAEVTNRAFPEYSEFQEEQLFQEKRNSWKAVMVQSLEDKAWGKDYTPKLSEK